MARSGAWRWRAVTALQKPWPVPALGLYQRQGRFAVIRHCREIDCRSGVCGIICERCEPGFHFITSGISTTFQALETAVCRSHPATRDVRKTVGQYIMVSAVRIFRCDGEPAVALVQISRAGHISPILRELAIVAPAGPALPGSALDPLAAFQRLHGRFLRGVGVAVGSIDRKPVRSPTDQRGNRIAAL